MIDCGHIAHIDVIFHRRAILHNITSICWALHFEK